MRNRYRLFIFIEEKYRLGNIMGDIPKTIVLTTPNREYNVIWENVGSEKFRHHDHRFEWTRQEFSAWATEITQRFGYTVRFLPIGQLDEQIGAPTQMAIFTRQETDERLPKQTI